MNQNEESFPISVARVNDGNRSRTGPTYGVVRDAYLDPVRWTAAPEPSGSPLARSAALRERSENVVLTAATQVNNSRELISASRMLMSFSQAAGERHRVRMDERREKLEQAASASPPGE